MEAWGGLRGVSCRRHRPRPSSPSPQGYHEYIDENLPPESPYLYGLHPNAEIGFLTVTSEKLFRTVLEMQPKESDSAGGTGVSREEKAGPAPASRPPHLCPRAQQQRGPGGAAGSCRAPPSGGKWDPKVEAISEAGAPRDAGRVVLG